MRQPEKNEEPFTRTVKRTFITTTVIAVVLFLLRAFPSYGRSNLAVFATIWPVVFCIVFGGHWLELLFINHIKFALPKNIFLLYLARACYWFLCAIPLFALASLTYNLLLHRASRLGVWWAFGLLYIGIQLVMYAIMQVEIGKEFL